MSEVEYDGESVISRGPVRPTDFDVVCDVIDALIAISDIEVHASVTPAVRNALTRYAEMRTR